MVLFCQSREADQCKDVHEQLTQLGPDSHAPLNSMRLAEVDCSLDMQLCHEQGFATQTAAVVHYFQGTRQAVWLSDGNDKNTPPQSFGRWMQMTFNRYGEGPWAWQGTWDRICNMPQLLQIDLAKVSPETAAFVFGLALVVTVVAWVIMEGFELWPKALDKSE